MSTTLITKVSSIPYPYASQKSPRVHNLSPTHLTIVEFLSPPGYPCSCRVSSFPALYPPLLQATPSYLPPSVPAGTAPTRVPCDRPVSPLPWASAALLPSSSTGGPTLPPVVIVHRKSPLDVRTCQSNARCHARCARCKALRAGRRRGRDEAETARVATTN